MLDKLRKIKQLKEMQDALSQEREEVGKNGIRVIVNGKMEIEEIQLNPGLDIREQEKVTKECINEAMKKIQMKTVQKIAQMPGFSL